MAPTPLPDWQTDWLYALVLRQAEEAWAQCNRDPDRWEWKYVLIEEYPEARGASCRGDVVRAWIRDAGGLREITLAEDERLTADILQYPVFPFILLEFHILPDRQRVAIGHRRAGMGGRGWRYLVRGEGAEAALEDDPSGGFWRS